MQFALRHKLTFSAINDLLDLFRHFSARNQTICLQACTCSSSSSKTSRSNVRSRHYVVNAICENRCQTPHCEEHIPIQRALRTIVKSKYNSNSYMYALFKCHLVVLHGNILRLQATLVNLQTSAPSTSISFSETNTVVAAICLHYSVLISLAELEQLRRGMTIQKLIFLINFNGGLSRPCTQGIFPSRRLAVT